ncbi:MAG TPA: helix-turn-helix domain-containing protein [Solirubrobacterales bacterium]
MPGRSWDTAAVPTDEQFAYWSDMLGAALCRVTMVRPDEGAFAGQVEVAAVGPVDVATITSQAQAVRRTDADVRRQAGDAFFLNMTLRGCSTFTQGGRTGSLGPGDFALVDGAQPFDFEFDGPFEQVSLTVPHDILAPHLASPATATAVAVRGDRGLGAIAAGTIAAMSRGTAGIDRGVTRPLVERVAGLVGLTLGAEPTKDVGPTALTQLALDEVERSLADPELSPGIVADRIGVSTRYLHRLFEDRGQSFGRHLLARRLERCQAALVDPGLSHLTVGEIAWRNGFTDPSYLARAYRRRFGVSPTQARGSRGESDRGRLDDDRATRSADGARYCWDPARSS